MKYTFFLSVVITLAILLSEIIHPGVMYHLLTQIGFEINILLLGVSIILFSRKLKKSKVRLEIVSNSRLSFIGLVITLIAAVFLSKEIINANSYKWNRLIMEIPLMTVAVIHFVLFKASRTPAKTTS